MYDEYPHIWPNSVEKSSSAPSSGFHLPDFPTNQITTPVAVLVGGQDSLPDVEFLKSGLRSGVFWLEIEGEFLFFFVFWLSLSRLDCCKC